MSWLIVGFVALNAVALGVIVEAARVAKCNDVELRKAIDRLRVIDAAR